MQPQRSAQTIALTLLILWANLGVCADLYVSPLGTDWNPGTESAPLRTLGAARDAVRTMAGHSAVTLHVADGTYYLPDTLVFTAADSGTEGCPVLYRAEHEGQAVISGGARLALTWEPYKDGIFQASTPPGLAFDQVFIDPAQGDFRVSATSPALKIGFRNFPMDRFGVRKPALRALAKTPVIPAVEMQTEVEDGSVATRQYWLGALLHGL